MARGMGAFSLAQDVIEAIRSVVREELNKQRPKPRYATVQSINHEDRSCMVNFIGEGDNPVRVPFGSVAPATVGQEVRIGGTATDRTIEDVRGPSNVEDRAQTLEENIVERQFAFVYARLAATMNVSDTVRKVPFTSTPQAPIGVTSDSTGGWRANVSGYYEMDSKVNILGDNGTTESRMWLQIVPAGGGAPYDIDHDEEFIMFTDGSGARGRFSNRVGALWYLNAGDVATVMLWRDQSREVYADSSYFRMRLVAAIPQQQFPEVEQ